MNDEPILGSGHWVGVDLDRTLAHYDKFEGETVIGAPIAPMVDLVKTMLSKHYDVRIFTARVCPKPILRGDGAPPFTGTAHIVQAIEQWCLLHIGQILPVTCMKDFGMTTLYDDRAVAVVPNSGTLVSRFAFKEGAKFVIAHSAQFLEAMVKGIDMAPLA